MIRSAIDQLDHLAAEMESKWGVDRLPHLVGGDLRDRFLGQRVRLDEAIASGDAERTASTAAAMERAWKTLDTVAMANGQMMAIHKVWETTLPDGRVLAIVKDKRVYRTPSRADVVFTLDEVAKIIGGMPELVIAAKAKFPGAEITGITDVGDTFDWKRGDELPPGLSENAA